VASGAVRGLKLHPPVQEFVPNDRLAYPLYEVFAEARLPVLFHTGHSGIGTMPKYSLPALAAYYRERKMAAVAFGVDSISQTGEEPVPSNEEVAELAAEHADVIIPFASIDPARGAAGVRAARRLITDHGVRGFKFHPNTQAFFPNDRAAYPLYEVIAEHGRIALFHTGQTGVGAGRRAGGGIRLKYSNPLHVDDVAVDFPDMPIILAHPSFPWQDEALSVATHKPQVYIDLSGWSPKYFPPQLVQYANSLLKDKVLFGSDFPVITPDRWLEDFAGLPIKDEVRPKILKENAAKLFGLGHRS
jgi:predicted TIM-barrel fold metal-dependent hydrolase